MEFFRGGAYLPSPHYRHPLLLFSHTSLNNTTSQPLPKPIFTGLEAIAGDDDERVLQVKNFEAIGEMANSLLVKVCKQIKIRKLKYNFVIV